MKYTPGCDLKAFVGEMTLEQKIKLQATLTDITSEAQPELGLPEMCIADGATGINYLQVYLDRAHRIMRRVEAGGKQPPDYEIIRSVDKVMDEILADVEKAYKKAERGTARYELVKELHDLKPNGTEPTCFPSGVVLGSTWNPDMIYECGKRVGEEMDAFGVDVVLGPNVDIQRDPLGGRAYECYSEDPLLVSRAAAAYINGLQSTGIAACAKHFAVNNQETKRNSINAIVSRRALREVYLKGFESAVKNANVKSIMMAYNKVNGVHCAENSQLMKDILRNEWGFEGCVVSDWGAARNEPVSIKAGLDLVLPSRRWDIKKAIESGELDEADLDRACLRIMQLYESLNGMKGRAKTKYNDRAAMKAAYDCTVDGAILLKNDGALPIAQGTPTLFWGKRSRKLIECGGGSTQIFTEKTSSVYGRACEVNGAENCRFEERFAGAKVLVYTVAYPGHESADNPSLLVEHEDRLKMRGILTSAKDSGMKTVVVLNTAGPVDISGFMDFADAVLCVYIPGCEGGNAIADMLYGLASPAGRLAQTFPVKYTDSPSAINFPGSDGTVMYGEDIFVGYRYYDYKDVKPLFPFGYGLSYTNFEISCGDEHLEMTADSELTVPVTVKNIGDREGAEVVQLYVGETHSRLKRPVRELRDFKKVYLKPGQEKSIELKLDRHSLEFYDPENGGWIVEPGDYVVYIGRSSRDFTAVIPLKVTGENPYGIDANTSINEVAENPQMVKLMSEIIPDFEKRLPDLLQDFAGESLLEVYDALMPDYYLNPIHGMAVFYMTLRKASQSGKDAKVLFRGGL